MGILLPHGTAAKHYFARTFSDFSFLTACYGETLLLVCTSFCAPTSLLGVSSRTVVARLLTANQFFSVVNINSTRLSLAQVLIPVRPPVSFSRQWSAGTRRVHVPHPLVLPTPRGTVVPPRAWAGKGRL